MHPEGAESNPVFGREESKMELSNNDVAGLCQTTMGAVNGGGSRQPVHQMPVGLTITVEKFDRVLADIDAQIELLQRDRTSLGLVRGELVRMEAKWRSA
jgi:hypothetical protein